MSRRLKQLSLLWVPALLFWTVARPASAESEPFWLIPGRTPLSFDIALRQAGSYAHSAQIVADSWSADESSLLCRAEYDGAADKDIRPQALYLMNLAAKAVYRIAASPGSLSTGPGLIFTWDNSHQNIWWALKTPQQELSLMQWQVSSGTYRRIPLLSAKQPLMPGYFLPGPKYILSDFEYERFFQLPLQRPYHLEAVQGPLPVKPWSPPQPAFTTGKSIHLPLKQQGKANWDQTFPQFTKAAQIPLHPDQVLAVTAQPVSAACTLHLQAYSVQTHQALWSRHFRLPAETCQSHSLRWYPGQAVLLIESSSLFAFHLQTQNLSKILDFPHGYEVFDTLFSPSAQYLAYTLLTKPGYTTQVVVIPRSYLLAKFSANGSRHLDSKFVTVAN